MPSWLIDLLSPRKKRGRIGYAPSLSSLRQADKAAYLEEVRQVLVE